MVLVHALLEHGQVVTDQSAAARELSRACWGTPRADGRLVLSPFEALFLMELNSLRVMNARMKQLSFAAVLRKFNTKLFWPAYVVFRYLKRAGYTVKTGLKFGVEFRVYEKGVRPGAHAKWLVVPLRERDVLKMTDFASKNRIGTSTNKHVLLAVVDDEDAVSFWDVSWVRP